MLQLLMPLVSHPSDRFEFPIQLLISYSLLNIASLNKSNTHGSLEAGKQGDMIVLDAPTWEHLVYQLVDPPIQSVIKKGSVIFERKD
jgi:imidazolonepropionase